MAWKLGKTEGGDIYLCDNEDCKGKAWYHRPEHCHSNPTNLGSCYCGKDFEWCANCHVEFCRNFLHIKHVCEQKVGDIKYFPPFVPKKVVMADMSMYSDVTKTPKSPTPMIASKVQVFLDKKEKNKKRIEEACQKLMEYNFVKKGDPTNVNHQRLALRIEHIWRAYPQDEKKLGKIYRHVIRKEKEFLPCIKAFVMLCKLSRYDAMLYRGSVQSFLHDVARVTS